MDEQLKKFLNKQVRVVDTRCTVGVEPLGNKEFVTIKFNELNIDKPIYQFWNKNTEHKKHEQPLEPDIGQIESKSRRGRKTYYAKISLKEIKKYTQDKLSYEYMGMLLRLTAYLEWESGYLIYGRGKHKRKMNRKDISKVLNVSDSTVRRFISRLEEQGLLVANGDGYKVIGGLFSKGRRSTCE